MNHDRDEAGASGDWAVSAFGKAVFLGLDNHGEVCVRWGADFGRGDGNWGWDMAT
jgi:hypothetical protein